MSSNELIADFGPYQLVVRHFGAEYVAVLWRTGGKGPAQRLLSASAPTLEEAKEALEQKFYEERVKHSSVADDQACARAFSYLWSGFTERQRQLLQAQYRADGRKLTTLDMADVVGWKSHSPVNLWYGLAGFAFFGEIPREIRERSAQGAPIYSFALSTGERVAQGGGEVWAWTMRPEVAKGLVLADCV